jgi:imidazolonepropionase-like amidohydrolase
MLTITNATVLLPTGETMENTSVVVENGKIHSVGRNVPLQSGHTIIDGTGKFVTPGIIDVHTHLGVHEQGLGKEGSDFNETSDPVTPQVRALDGINPMERGFQDAIKAGITTVQVMPGSANVIGGEMVALKTHGRIVDHMVLKSPSGMKAAFGENPKGVYGSKGKSPITRMGVAALFRQQLMKAQDYLRAQSKGDSGARDLGMENLCKVLRGEIPLRAHAHRADDIVTVLRLADEFNIRITIEHCTEGHLIAEYVAEKGVRVSVGPTMSTKSKVELADKGWHTVIALAKAGVPVSITTDHPVVGIEYLMTSVATAVKHGLDARIAFQAVTINAAKHIGVEDRVGSIEVGKDADLVVWSGNPLDIRNSVEKTIIDGNVIYSAETE